MNLLRSATLTVADPAAAAARYQQWLDYAIVETGSIAPELAASWGATASAGRPYVVLRPASGTAVDIRLVQGDPMPGFVPLRTYGWAAIEICVKNVFDAHERMKTSPFDVVGPPNPIAVLPEIHPMQVRGPDGEIVYLTEIKLGGPGSGLPDVNAPIDKLFICVLACPDMSATARWAGERLKLHIADEISIPYRMINQSFGFPKERQHRLTSADHEKDIFLEFDQYPEEATARPTHPGQLPPGVSICTISHPAIDSVAGPWFSPPVARPGAIYGGRRVGVLKTPEGALLEVVEGL